MDVGGGAGAAVGSGGGVGGGGGVNVGTGRGEGAGAGADADAGTGGGAGEEQAGVWSSRWILAELQWRYMRDPWAMVLAGVHNAVRAWIQAQAQAQVWLRVCTVECALEPHEVEALDCYGRAADKITGG